MVSCPGIAAGRLAEDVLDANFLDIRPPLDPSQAKIAADRCLFCWDAPCTRACPTSIDVPLFVRQIATGNRLGAARTILEANVLGGTCARVCPTETLCEEVCVRVAQEGRPVEIGRLQRFATEAVVEGGVALFERAARTGRCVAIVGAGPAGLACAHELARLGHDVTLFEASDRLGGLNETGLAAYKMTNDFAAREVAWLLEIGGITVETGKALGRDLSLYGLTAEYDAVFLGLGLGATNAVGFEDDLAGVVDAVDWIADLRSAASLADVSVGARVVVIGGGMTAIDAASQARRLGADEVTIAYRRGLADMGASDHEKEIARNDGALIRTHLAPRRLVGVEGRVAGVEFERTRVEAGKVVGTGETATIPADQVLLAIGQTLVADVLGDGVVALAHGRIAVDASGRTSNPKIWAGGDCADAGRDLTVEAVAAGRNAARSIDATLRPAG
ncbi:MAG: NAD(P)-dependent oxidoreductase [Hyphomicrobiales bacterium]|nr:NAD(P)-dependent oxidoreductase [Hyphomicrobiales bacterium]